MRQVLPASYSGWLVEPAAEKDVPAKIGDFNTNITENTPLQNQRDEGELAAGSADGSGTGCIVGGENHYGAAICAGNWERWGISSVAGGGLTGVDRQARNAMARDWSTSIGGAGGRSG